MKLVKNTLIAIKSDSAGAEAAERVLRAMTIGLRAMRTGLRAMRGTSEKDSSQNPSFLQYFAAWGTSCGFCAVSVRFLRGFRAVSVRFLCGVCAVSVRFLCGFCAVSVRFPRGFSARFVANSD